VRWESVLLVEILSPSNRSETWINVWWNCIEFCAPLAAIYRRTPCKRVAAGRLGLGSGVDPHKRRLRFAMTT
jgi:hypothetical protein